MFSPYRRVLVTLREDSTRDENSTGEKSFERTTRDAGSHCALEHADDESSTLLGRNASFFIQRKASIPVVIIPCLEESTFTPNNLDVSASHARHAAQESSRA